MDQVVQAINEKHSEFELKLISFDARGRPHAKFTVCQVEYVQQAQKQINNGYEANRVPEENQKHMMFVISELFKHQNQLTEIINTFTKTP